MKSTERHKLKENEFARSVAQARAALEARSGHVGKTVVAVVLAIALAGGYFWWRSTRDAKANGLLAAALTTYESPVVPPQPPKPGSPPPLPQPGTFQSEKERLDAALPKFIEAAGSNPRSDAAITARYHAASIQAALGKHAEAEQSYKEVVDRAGSGIYGRTARLGMAVAQVAQGKFEPAIAGFTELSRDTTSSLPMDGILMQLGKAQALAGKKDDAAATFSRIVNEFPQSPYVTDARREAEEAKKR
jgi:TolA-binding protein